MNKKQSFYALEGGPERHSEEIGMSTEEIKHYISLIVNEFGPLLERESKKYDRQKHQPFDKHPLLAKIENGDFGSLSTLLEVGLFIEKLSKTKGYNTVMEGVSNRKSFDDFLLVISLSLRLKHIGAKKLRFERETTKGKTDISCFYLNNNFEIECTRLHKTQRFDWATEMMKLKARVSSMFPRIGSYFVTITIIKNDPRVILEINKKIKSIIYKRDYLNGNVEVKNKDYLLLVGHHSNKPESLIYESPKEILEEWDSYMSSNLHRIPSSGDLRDALNGPSFERVGIFLKLPQQEKADMKKKLRKTLLNKCHQMAMEGDVNILVVELNVDFHNLWENTVYSIIGEVFRKYRKLDIALLVNPQIFKLKGKYRYRAFNYLGIANRYKDPNSIIMDVLVGNLRKIGYGTGLLREMFS